MKTDKSFEEEADTTFANFGRRLKFEWNEEQKKDVD